MKIIPETFERIPIIFEINNDILNLTPLVLGPKIMYKSLSIAFEKKMTRIFVQTFIRLFLI